jgi:hypothetical protein
MLEELERRNYLHLSRRHMDAVPNPLDTLAITASVENNRDREAQEAMIRPTLEVADIVRTAGNVFGEKYGSHPCMAASQGARCHRPLPHCSIGRSSRSVRAAVAIRPPPTTHAATGTVPGARATRGPGGCGIFRV